MTPETHYARNGNVHIAYQVWGAGELDLVCPGIRLTRRAVLGTAGRPPLLGTARLVRAVIFDRRGTGLSDPFTVETACLILEHPCRISRP